MKLKYCLLLLLTNVSAFAVFEYDRAVFAAQHKNWQQAQDLLTPLVARCPCNPQILYDTGVAAYNLGQYTQALAYFNNLVRLRRAEPALKEKAYFNAGNAYVKLEELEKAIESFQQALEINPANEQAAHNLEVVKKMLEEKQRKKEQDDAQQNQSDEKNQSDEQHGQSDDTKGGNKESSSQGKGKKGNGTKESRGESSNSAQREPGTDQDGKKDKQSGFKKQSGEKHRQKDRLENGDDESDNNSNRPGDDQVEDQADNKNAYNKQDQNISHDVSPEDKKGKDTQRDTTSTDSKSQQSQETIPEKYAQLMDGKSEQERNDKWLEHILQMREDGDKRAGKRRLQRNVGSNLVGKDGQNCW